MPIGERLLMGFFLLIASAGALLTFTFRNPEARSFPLIVGIVTSLLIVAYFVIKSSEALSTRLRPYIVDDLFMKIDAEAADADQVPEPAVLQRERKLIGLLIGFGLVAWVIGLTIAVPVFLLVVMRGFAGESWRSSIIVTIGTALFLHVVFVEILRMRLHFGLLGGL